MDFDDPTTYFQNLIKEQQIEAEVRDMTIEMPMRTRENLFKMNRREFKTDIKKVVKEQKQQIVLNTDLELEFDDIADGFIASTDKKSFITEHTELIQMLDFDDQGELISLFMEHI